jgi:hypothetical protein
MHNPSVAASPPGKRGEAAGANLTAAGTTFDELGARASGALPRLISTLRQVEARRQLDSELRAIALDLLGLYEAEELPRECALWVRTTVEAAVSEVSEPAVSVLALRLRSALRAAPTDVARRIDAARLRHEAGLT